MTAFVLGIDLGTTTCRAAIFDADGREVAWASVETAVSYPRPRWAEVDPEVWWQATTKVIRHVLAAAGEQGIPPHQIAAVGLTGLMHAPVLLDDAGQPV